MKRRRFTFPVLALALAAIVSPWSTPIGAADDTPQPGGHFVVDVAMDGATWRMNDGINPFFPVFTGALGRGNTFMVSGRIYPSGTLQAGGTFGGGVSNPSGPETGGAIGT